MQCPSASGEAVLKVSLGQRALQHTTAKTEHFENITSRTVGRFELIEGTRINGRIGNR